MSIVESMPISHWNPEDIAADLGTALAPSDNGRFLVRHEQPTAPFYYLADTAWELFHRLDKVEAELYLRNRASKGFNSIMVVVMAEHGGLDFPNRYGEWPFLPSAESKDGAYLPDIYKPNPGYFEFIDWVIALASSLDMTISLVPTWGRYINGGYYGRPILFDEANAEAFGRFLGERYPFHPFILGGDSNRYWNRDFKPTLEAGKDLASLPIEDFGAVTEAMARGLQAGERAAIASLDAELRKRAEGYETFLVFHSAQVWLANTPETTGSAQFPTAEWLTLDGMQTGHFDGPKPERDTPANNAAYSLWYSKSSYIPIRKMYATPRPDGRPRPVVELEAHYENTHHWFDYDCPDVWDADDIRNGMWQGVFAGACGYTYGVNSIWQMHNAGSKTHPPIEPPTTACTDWYLELDLEGSFQASVAREIMLSLPSYFTRVPDQSLITSDTHERPGERAGDRLVSGMRGDGWAAVHLPYGGDVGVDLGRALPGSSDMWRAWWIDPRTGGREVFATGEERGEKTFTAPSGGTKADDWILLITTGSYPIPA